jgi:hypothetical protein
MKVKIKYIKILSVLLVLVSVQLTACSSQSSQQNSQSGSSQSDPKSENVPSDLTELENNIEMIVKTLDGPSIQTKQEMLQSSESMQSGQSSQSNQSSQNSQNSQSSQSSQSQQGSQSSQQGQGQKSQPSSSSQQDPMVKISPIVDKMHYQWNNLMPVAIKKGANKNLINNFDNALNNLSNTIISKNKINTMIAANKLYANIPDLYTLFESKSLTEIKRVRYYSRSAILNSLTADWTKADSDMGNLKSVWVLYKSSINKDQLDISNKLDLSIYELEKVIKERNKPLVNIKGKVEFSNIEALENKSGEQSSNQQSS